MFSGADPWTMPEAEVKKLFGTPTAGRKVRPTLGSEIDCGVACYRNAPMVLVPVCMPDIQQQVRPSGNK